MQMAVTGVEWCDFFNWQDNEFHLEIIYFDVKNLDHGQ